jgi:hypothetical protein
MLAIAVAGSVLALSGGCSSQKGGSASAAASTPLSLPENPRSIDVPVTPTSTATANNSAQLATAQAESDFNGKVTARDLDLGGGNGGGGAPASGPLTYQALGQALQQLGVNAQDNQTYYSVSVKAHTDDNQDWTFPISVSLSKDQSVIWIDCGLVQIDKNGTPTAQALMNILSANNQMGITYFVLGDNHLLVLQQPFTNIGITPQALGQNLKGFFNALKGSEPLWSSFFPSSGGGNSGGGGNGGGGNNGGGNPFQ